MAEVDDPCESQPGAGRRSSTMVTTLTTQQHDWDREGALSDEEPPRPFAIQHLLPLGCGVCVLAGALGLVVALATVVGWTSAPSIADLNAFLRGVTTVANDDDDAHPPSAAASGWSCADTTWTAVQSQEACGAEPWCAQLREAAEVSHAEIVALSSTAENAPLMVNALDYRYFDSCHATNSINLWEAVLYCELQRAEPAHPQDSIRSGNSLAELEEATRGRSLHEPLQNLTAALAAQIPVVFYCANPS